MESFDIYKDIAGRTNGDIYIGVVGPVRTGKSTFIKRVMDSLVLPNIEDEARKQRIIDELPQSADGKIVMTTQPKFVPDGGVRVNIADGVSLNVRLIDCVGYLIDNMEGESRNVRTPWSEQEMPFEQASELGTRKVMADHSTIGVVVTTDGSIAEFKRSDYVEAEERIVKEMKELGKPFCILLNSKNCDSDGAKHLRAQMQERYGVPVLLKDAQRLTTEDMIEVFECILSEFPLKTIRFDMPKWLRVLPADNAIIKHIMTKIAEKTDGIKKMRDYKSISDLFGEDEYIKPVKYIKVNYKDGSIDVDLTPHDSMFYRILSEACDVKIEDEFTLFRYIKEAAFAEKQYSKMKNALQAVEENGYGVVLPLSDEIVLHSPEFIKSGNRESVKMRATASCMHIMRVDVEAEVNPIAGGGSSQEVVNYLKKEYEGREDEIWNTNVLGKTLSELAKDGLNSKMYGMPQDAQNKLRKTLGRIINEGKGGVLCVLL